VLQLVAAEGCTPDRLVVAVDQALEQGLFNLDDDSAVVSVRNPLSSMTSPFAILFLTGHLMDH
jgi:hypothetical protein